MFAYRKKQLRNRRLSLQRRLLLMTAMLSNYLRMELLTSLPQRQSRRHLPFQTSQLPHPPLHPRPQQHLLHPQHLLNSQITRKEMPKIARTADRLVRSYSSSFIAYYSYVSFVAIGNGGRTEKYVWTQTLADVCVNIALPAGTKSKMLNVEIKNTSLKVRKLDVLLHVFFFDISNLSFTSSSSTFFLHGG